MKLDLFHDLSWLRCTPITLFLKVKEIILQNYAKAQLLFINHTLVVNKIPKQIKIISSMSHEQNGEETLRSSFLKMFLNTELQLSV